MSEPQLISLIGGESSGKTTLARALAEALPALDVPEVVREFVNIHGRPPYVDEQRTVMRDQIAAEDAAKQRAMETGVPFVVGDPAALMTALYSIVYFDDRSLLAEALERQAAYALTVWCDITFPWQAEEGMRDGPEFRAHVHELIASVVENDGLSVLLVTGSVAERVAAVKAQIESVG